MFRGIVMLGILCLVLIGAGIVHITWNSDSGSATVSFDKDKAKQAAAKVIDEAKTLEANLEKNAKQSTTK